MSAVRTGRPMSAETRAKIAATKRGKKLSPETRAKMSAAHAGREPMSAETWAKIGAAKRGKTASAETRAKISASKKGSGRATNQCAKTCAQARRKTSDLCALLLRTPAARLDVPETR